MSNYDVMNRTALVLRGMTLDPRTPYDMREVMHTMIRNLERACDATCPDCGQPTDDLHTCGPDKEKASQSANCEASGRINSDHARSADHTAQTLPIKGVRVEGAAVVITVKGGNEAARFVCNEILRQHKP